MRMCNQFRYNYSFTTAILANKTLCLEILIVGCLSLILNVANSCNSHLQQGIHTGNYNITQNVRLPYLENVY